jgi:hypothetical protein
MENLAPVPCGRTASRFVALLLACFVEEHQVSAVAVALSIPTGSRLRQDGGSPRLKTWGSSSQETSASAKAAAWWPPPQHRRPPPEPQGHVQTNVTSALIDPPGLSVGAGPVPAGLRACPQLSQQTAVVNLIRRNRSQTEEALLAMGDTPWCRTGPNMPLAMRQPHM